MSELLATFRWEMRTDEARSVYAEGLLREMRQGHYVLTVYLVCDALHRPGGREGRIGRRVHVGTSHDGQSTRRLAFLAPVEGRRLAHELIYKEVRAHPDVVASFGDPWLSNLLGTGQLVSDTRQKYGAGRKIGVYAELPVKRSCSCPDPVLYRDEDDDPACFRCGHLVKAAKAA